MMDQREFVIETPIGSVRSDSGNHGLDVLSVLGVVCILYVGRILMKKIIKRFIGWMVRAINIELSGPKILKKVIGEYLMARKSSKPKKKKTTTSKQKRKYGGY